MQILITLNQEHPKVTPTIVLGASEHIAPFR